MKNMKILTLLLCASLAFAYMGCSNSSGGSDSGTYTPSGNNGNGTPGGSQQGGNETLPQHPTKVGTQTIGETTYDIVTFGSFPQSLKADGIDVNESVSKTAGSFTYYKGSDNEWYAKIVKNAQVSYYKVEPIKWRVLTTNYNGSGKKLLLAEKVLINCKYYDYYNVNRIISSATISPNNYEHSRIRAYLNGLSYQKKASDSANQETDEAFVNKGFFQTAFTQAEQAAIATTTVINNARSTNPDSNDKQWNNGDNPYAGYPTEDKIFLLSEQEVTKADYGFADCNAYVGDHNGTTTSTRIRMSTAFARANGAGGGSRAGYGGWWWLRSPYSSDSRKAYRVYEEGKAHINSSVDISGYGVVPALCLN